MAEVCFPRLHKSVRWACKLHKNQDRDGRAAVPYIAHVLEVVTNLRYVGGIEDEEMLCAAALHDSIEQSGVSLKKIEDKFGIRVAKLVEEMTRSEPTEAEIAGMSEHEVWQLRSNMLLDEIRRMSPECRKIKLADRLSNLQFALRTKIAGKLERHLAQTEEILNIVPRSVNHGLWDAIRAALDGAKTSGASVQNAENGDREKPAKKAKKNPEAAKSALPKISMK